jgi:hypothetical protein
MKSAQKFDFFTFGVELIIIAIELGLGINLAFVSHALISPAFPEWPTFTLALSFLIGGLLGTGASAVIVKRKKAADDITSYAQANGTDPLNGHVALWVVILFFVGLDIFGLLYRLQFLTGRGAGWLVSVGILLAILPLPLSEVIHPMKHKPVEVIQSDVVEKFDRDHVVETYGVLRKLPIKIRHAAYNGNLDIAVEEATRYLIEQDDRKRNRRLYIERRKERFVDAVVDTLLPGAAPKAVSAPTEKQPEQITEGEVREDAVVNFPKARR